MFALGCHFSEYAIHREFNDARTQDNSPNGDAFGEQYLFQNERGAVGTFGSSGFEYLNQTNAFMNVTAAVWFYDAPYDTNGQPKTQAEWQFGQLMFLVESQIAGSQRDRWKRYTSWAIRSCASTPARRLSRVTVNGAPRAAATWWNRAARGTRCGWSRWSPTRTRSATSSWRSRAPTSATRSSSSRWWMRSCRAPASNRVSFRHKVRPETYDIVLRAYQAPDTLAGNYHMVASSASRWNRASP